MQIITESNLLVPSPSSDCRITVAATPIHTRTSNGPIPLSTFSRNTPHAACYYHLSLFVCATLDDGLGWELYWTGSRCIVRYHLRLSLWLTCCGFVMIIGTLIKRLVQLVGQMTFVLKVWSWFFNRYVQSR